MADYSLFLSVEEVGLYSDEDKAMRSRSWPSTRICLALRQSRQFLYICGRAGRLEILKAFSHDRCHVAIEVSIFDKAVEVLRALGIELEAPNGGRSVRGMFLKQRDPAGKLVHLFWQAKSDTV